MMINNAIGFITYFIQEDNDRPPQPSVRPGRLKDLPQPALGLPHVRSDDVRGGDRVQDCTKLLCTTQISGEKL